MHKLTALLLAGSLFAGVVGCDDADDSLSQPTASQAVQPQGTAAAPPAPANAPPKESPKMAKIVGAKPKYDDPPPTRPRIAPASTGRSNFHDAAWAADVVMKEISDAGVRPAMAVWVVDQAPGGNTRGEVMQAVSKAYGRLPKEVAANLTTAVVAAGDEVHLLTPEPIADSAPLQLALTDASVAKGPTKLFAAVEQATEKFLTLAARQKRDVVLAVVSSEGGGDLDKLDDAVAALRKQNSGLSYFTITAPTPFSKKAGKGPSESLYPEQIDMAYADLQGDNDIPNSGFGPFGICRLAKEVRGGRVLLLDGGSSLDASVMKKYAPEYVSEKQYAELIAQNKARKALYDAASIKQHTEILGMRGQSRFVKTDEAGFQRQLSNSQRTSALLEQNLSRLYDTLAAGESDRKNLTSPRLQAEYDLAYGRVLAAKARNDGYNAMLAVIKQGKAFKSPKSGSWLLDESDDLTEAGSVLAGMAKKSRKYLEAVVKDHPGTPWATIAQRELGHQSGWKWSED